MENMRMASFMLIVAIGCVMMQTTNGFIHVVGGSTGWDVPPNKVFYDKWAAPRTFGVGDELVFPFSPASHSVVQVSKEDYDTCGHTHVIKEFMMGPVRMPLTETGDYYFFCGVGTHCEMGQKLRIMVENKPGCAGRPLGRKMLSSEDIETTKSLS